MSERTDYVGVSGEDLRLIADALEALEAAGPSFSGTIEVQMADGDWTTVEVRQAAPEDKPRVGVVSRSNAGEAEF